MRNLFIPTGLVIINFLFHSGLKAQHPSSPKTVLTANLGAFTQKQVEAGSALFSAHCASCHGRDLRGTENGNALVGERFVSKWSDKSVGQLFNLTKASMPKTNPHSHDDTAYASLIEYSLNANGLVTKTLLFAGEGAGLYGSDGGGGNKFRAYDKATGTIVSEIELPANQSGLPMTYSINGKQYIVVAVAAIGHPGELVALSL